MPQRIDWSVKTRIEGGPLISIAGSLDVEAYDVIKIALEDGATDAELLIQPAPQVEQIKFLMIESSAFSDDITYKVNDAGNDATALDQPHVFTGQGAVSRATGGEAPARLFFSNGSGEEVAVHVYVGRDAAP